MGRGGIVQTGIACVVVSCAVLFASTGAASAAEVKLSTSITPSTVSLAPGAAATGTLVISATEATAGEQVSVTVRPRPADNSVTVALPKGTARLHVDGAVPLKFVVHRRSEGAGQNVPVTFVVASRSKPMQVSTATMMVAAVSSPELLSAKIESNVQTIDENRPGEAALVVTNPRESDLAVSELDVAAPTGVTVTVRCPLTGANLIVGAGTSQSLTQCPLAISGRSQAVLHIELAPKDAVVPGPRSLLIKIDAVGPQGRPFESVVTTIPFTIDVFAESDILKSVGVPVFLLLPGVIIVLTTWFLVRTFSPWRSALHGRDIGGPVSTATFTAVVSLAVSLIVAKAYPFLTRTYFPGVERDYLKAYGFRDFYYVIAYSFLIAVALWLLACVLYVFAPLGRKLWVPSPGDEAPTLLRKVGWRAVAHRKASFPRVRMGEKGALDLGRRRGGETLVSPMIAVVLKPAGAYLEGLIEADTRDNHPFHLWWEVSKAVRDDKATIGYRPDDIVGLHLVDSSTPISTGVETPLVTVSHVGE